MQGLARPEPEGAQNGGPAQCIEGRRGIYVKTTTREKQLFRDVCDAIGLAKAVANPTFHHVPAKMLYGWAKDQGALPSGLRRKGGGRPAAYTTDEMQAVFKGLEQLRNRQDHHAARGGKCDAGDAWETAKWHVAVL
jgi:hypothetical protein